MKENFEKALAAVLKSEGGFVNNPKDPGGMTNLGVTIKTWESFVGRNVTEKEMRNLTPEMVGKMYQQKYWNAVKADDLPEGVDYLAFDFAVNAGPGRAAKLLQQAVGVTADGAIGPATLKAVAAMQPADLIEKYSAAKESFYRSLPTFETFGKGWLRRIAEVKTISEGMIG
jgi:lysozyme family protein